MRHSSRAASRRPGTPLEEGLALQRDLGEPLAAARLLTELGSLLQQLGEPGGEEPILEALELLDALPPGPELVSAFEMLAGVRLVSSAYAQAVAAAEQRTRARRPARPA